MKKLLLSLIIALLMPLLAWGQASPQPVYDQATDIETDSAGWNGNLAPTDNTVQKALQKFDDYSPTGGVWGSITGTLSSQTDLQNALNAKQNNIGLGTTAQYFRGDLSLATFPTVPTLTSQLTNDSGFLTTISPIVISGTNVGISTAAASAKLDVEGTVYVGVGNLGIGTYAPTSIVQATSTAPILALNSVPAGIGGIDVNAPGVWQFDSGTVANEAINGSTWTGSLSGAAAITASGCPLNSAGCVTGNGSASTYFSTTNPSLGTGNWTIEFWWTPNTNGAYPYVSQGSNGNFNDFCSFAFGAAFICYVGGDVSSHGMYYNVTPSYTTVAGTPVHLALVRSGSSIYEFIGGVSQTLTPSFGGVQNHDLTQSSVLYWGYRVANGDQPLNGKIDGLRVSNTARWTSNFTPPASPYTTLVSNSTVQLQKSGAVAWNIKSNGSAVVADSLQIGTANAGSMVTVLPTSGYVGINTVSPIARLDIAGEGNTSATNGLSVKNSDNTQIFLLNNAGNIGMGSSSPVNNLEMSNGTIRLGLNLPNASVGTFTNTDFKLISNNTARVTVKNAGNVGINSVNPQAKLDVEGSVYVGNGNVGIATAVPRAALDVQGSAYFNGGNVGISTGAPTGLLGIEADNLGSNEQFPALTLTNTTAGTSGTNLQVSPAIILSGRHYVSSADKESQWAIVNAPNATGDYGYLRFYAKQGAGAWSKALDLDSYGQWKSAVNYNVSQGEVLTWGFKLTGDGTADATADKYSPGLLAYSVAWKTQATAASQYMSSGFLNAPEQGSVSPIGVTKWIYGTNTQTPVEANELMRLQWGSDAGVTGVHFNRRLLADYTLYLAKGNMGIGTVAPRYQLEVDGGIYATNFYANTGNIGISTTGATCTCTRFENGLCTSGSCI